MPYVIISRHLSHEDLASAIVYVRSIPPAHIKQPKHCLPMP